MLTQGPSQKVESLDEATTLVAVGRVGGNQKSTVSDCKLGMPSWVFCGFWTLLVQRQFCCALFFVCRPSNYFLRVAKRLFLLQTECCNLGFEWDRNFNVTLLVLRTFQLDGFQKRKQTLLPTDSVDNYAEPLNGQRDRSL